jgi:hypothetical protein
MLMSSLARIQSVERELREILSELFRLFNSIPRYARVGWFANVIRHGLKFLVLHYHPPDFESFVTKDSPC